MTQLRTIQSLQAGRGIAALAVVVCHAATTARDWGREHVMNNLLHGGFIGVDFFFVLSGFIIYQSTVGSGRSAKDYALARFRRVYLPYWPIGIAIALFYVLFPASVGRDPTSWSWLPSLTLLPVSRPALAVAWTLQYEIMFYLLFGLFYFSGHLRLGLLAWAIAMVAANIAGLDYSVPLDLINIEFLMGITVAILYRRGVGHPLLLLAAPVPFIVWLAQGADQNASWPVGLSFALLILPLAQLEARQHLRVPDWLTFLGAASYSIYLVHDPVMALTGRVFSGSPQWVVLTGAAITGFATGVAFHLLIERRILSLAGGDRRHQRLTGEAGGHEPAPATAAAPHQS